MNTTTLQPQSVFDYFAQINKIPRPSHHEEKMIEFLIDFGKSLGLDTQVDKGGNVLIKKPAFPGYENAKGIILQSHIDMVCEKVAGLDFDFFKDSIQTTIDGEWMTAKGTTLGADDGIGVAMQMAVLADKSLKHGPLQCLFTTSEETGLGGAEQLEPGYISGDYLLNLDSEDEGQIFISCAGGANTYATFPLTYEDIPTGFFTMKMRISGLVGGHSGDDIIKKRANVNKLLSRILLTLIEKYDARLCDIQSGGLHNAIPRDGYAIICVPNNKKEDVRVDFNIIASEIEEEFRVTEKTMQFVLESYEAQTQAISQDVTLRLIKALVGLPNGVLAMSQDIENFVETSSNLASVKKEGDEIKIVTSQRSNLLSARKNASSMMRSVFSLAGAQTESGDGYPGWKLNPNSPLLKIAVKTYTNMFGHEPLVLAIHAGLECGLFTEKYPNIDMISFGPTLRGVHSPDERLLIPTVKMVWDYLVQLVEDLSGVRS